MIVLCRILWSIPFYCIWQQDGVVKHIGSIIAGNHSTKRLPLDRKAKKSSTRLNIECRGRRTEQHGQRVSWKDRFRQEYGMIFMARFRV